MYSQNNYFGFSRSHFYFLLIRRQVKLGFGRVSSIQVYTSLCHSHHTTAAKRTSESFGIARDFNCSLVKLVEMRRNSGSRHQWATSSAMKSWLNPWRPHGIHAGSTINQVNSFWYLPYSPTYGKKSSRSMRFWSGAPPSVSSMSAFFKTKKKEMKCVCMGMGENIQRWFSCISLNTIWELGVRLHFQVTSMLWVQKGKVFYIIFHGFQRKLKWSVKIGSEGYALQSSVCVNIWVLTGEKASVSE